MRGKMARSAPRPPFGLPELPVAARTSRLSSREAGKALLFSQFESRRQRRPPSAHSSRYIRWRRSWRSWASIDNVAIGRASRRLIEIGSPVSSQ